MEKNCTVNTSLPETRMKTVLFLLCVFLVGGCLADCENEIKGKIKSFVKGKDWINLFNKYSNNGYIKSDEMKDFLKDAGYGTTHYGIS